jgi:DNA-binding SARP family transcriptional activator
MEAIISLEHRRSDELTAAPTLGLDVVGDPAIRILGPVEVWQGRERVPLGGRRQLVLFAFLALHANRAVSSDSLVDAVWGPARSGAGNRLQMAVCRLRRSLAALEQDGVALRSVVGGYMLSISPGVLDADVFRARIREGRQALAAGDPAGAVGLLGEALELWRGDPLAEVAFEDFALAEGRRLEELRLAATEARIEAELRLGRHLELVGELEALTFEHPTRERLAAQLITALYRSGRQADALECYQRTRVHLAREFGLEPGPALKKLQARILQQDPSLELAPGASSSVSREATTAPVPTKPGIERRRDVGDVSIMLVRSGVRAAWLSGRGLASSTTCGSADARDQVRVTRSLRAG